MIRTVTQHAMRLLAACALVLAATAVVAGTATQAYAASGNSMTKSATTSSITLKVNMSGGYYLTSIDKATKQAYYASDNATKPATATIVGDQEIMFTGLASGTYYYLEADVSLRDAQGASYTAHVYCYGAKTQSPKVGSLKVMKESMTSSNSSQLKLQFTAKAIDGYQISFVPVKSGLQKKTLTKEYTTTKTTTIKYIYSPALSAKSKYMVRIRTFVYNIDGAKLYSDWSATQPMCRQPYPKVAKKPVKGGAKVYWTKVSGASSYTVYASTHYNYGYKKVATVKGTSKVVNKVNGKKLKKYTNYYIRIVANMKYNGKTYKSASNTYSYFYKYTSYR